MKVLPDLAKTWTGFLAGASLPGVPMFKICRLSGFLVACLLLAACATSTVEKRRAERPEVYAALSDAHRALVDKGDITVDMTEDAVYLAWGKPDQILSRGDKSGKTIRWLYEGTTSDTHYYWIAESVTLGDGRRILDRRLVPRTEFRDYVSAELVFRDGLLETWETLPRPPSRSINSGRGLGY